MVNSESFIKSMVAKKKEDCSGFSIVPNISQTNLVNAANKIAGGINPANIIAIYDDSLFGNAKEGIVFTGKNIYMKQMLSSSINISLENVASCNLTSKNVTDSKGNVKTVETVTVNYLDESVVTYTSSDFNKHNDFIVEILNGVIEEVETIEENNQVMRLEDLGDSVISSYLAIIIAYLKVDDGVIDSREYKELISLMAKIKVSKSLADELRELRLSSDVQIESFDILVNNLDKALQNQKCDNVGIHQSLFFDLLLVCGEKMNDWQNDSNLVYLAELLGITKEQADVGIRKIEADKRIVNERLEDNQVKEITKEFAAVAAGAGVTLAALAVTGGVSTGIWGGLMTLGLASTGGMFLGLAAIGGLGYGAYKGIKYFSGTSELEKFGIRISALQSAIESNKAATTYIIDDVNWLTAKITVLFKKIAESEELNGELMEQIVSYLSFAENVGESGQLINESSDTANYEINISKLPKVLAIDRFDELVKSNPNYVQIKDYVLSVYIKTETKTQDGFTKTTYEREDEISYENASKLYNIFESIGYYDTKASAVAQGQAIAKKGFNALKNMIGV